MNISCFTALMVSKWAHQSNDADASPPASQGDGGQWRRADGDGDGNSITAVPPERTKAEHLRPISASRTSAFSPESFIPPFPHVHAHRPIPRRKPWFLPCIPRTCARTRGLSSPPSSCQRAEMKGGARGSAATPPRQIITFINGQMDF